MKILITGGTGFIGSALSRDLARLNYKVIVITRHKAYSGLFRQQRVEVLPWNPPTLIPQNVISGIDAIVNLAGEPIAAKRWTKKQKELILSSRIDTTDAVVQSIKNANPRPKVLISASAIGYYGPHEDEYVTEDFPHGNDFLAEVCKIWESEALKAQGLGVRVVLLRIGAVIGSNGGALPKMAIPFKFFLGGPIGNGRQWFSWIHLNDIIGIIKYALENESISGPLNLTAPQPVTNKEFSSALGKTLGRPSWLPVPGFMLKIALGEFGSVLLTGQRVLPEKVLKAAYKFKYPEINEALRAIFGEKL